MLGIRAFVCQVCYLYAQTNRKISEVYEDSKRLAEKKIKAKKLELEGLEIAEVKGEEEIDLTIDEFEEEEEEVPLKFEKRKGGKAELEDTEALEVECPYCGEIFDDLATHIQNCEFAPEDASLEDVLPSKGKKKRKKKGGAKETEDEEESKEPQKCPYCGKEFQRLARHLTSCKKRPKGAKEEETEEEDEEEGYDEEEDEEDEDFDDE